MSSFDPAAMGEGEAPGAKEFVRMLSGMEAPRVLEVGTLRWDEDFPTHHRRWAPHADWTMSDTEAGTDVDVVDDAHVLAHWLRDAFDAYLACSVFEHLARPWKAMAAAARVLRPGGLLYVQTHQTFPLHGYPSDYFRFSDQALEVLAGDAGLDVLHAGYMYPCTIVPPPEVTRWNTAPDVEAWLNVELLARKPE